MFTIAHSTFSFRASADRQRTDGVLGTAVLRLRSSRSLASMLPALLSSGLMTLVVAAVMHAMWGEFVVGPWMESWLTAWPIAFPVAYLAGPALLKLAAVISAPAVQTARREAGLAFSDIVEASHRVTQRNKFLVLRGLKPAHDFNVS